MKKRILVPDMFGMSGGLLLAAVLTFTLILAGCPDPNSPGGDGDTPTVSGVTVTAAGGAALVERGGTLEFTASVNGEHLAESDKGVTWSVTGGGAGVTLTGGLLIVPVNQTLTDLTITAKSTKDESKSGTASVKVVAVYRGKAGDTDYELTVTGDSTYELAFGDKKSGGRVVLDEGKTVDQALTGGNLTLKPANNPTGGGNAPEFTVTVAGGGITGMDGTITDDNGGTEQAPETLTPGPAITAVTALNLSSLVTAPVRGATPVTAAINAEQYTGTVVWQNEAGTAHTGNFAASTVYKAVLTLTAKSGFTFNGVAANAFTYSGATAANAVNSGIVTITFPATAAENADTKVNALALDDLITAPVRNATPDTTAINAEQYTGTVAWQNEDGTAHTGVFSGSTVYKAVVTLTAKPGFTFTGVAANAFSYSGATAANAANSGTVTITFPETEGLVCEHGALAIESVSIAKPDITAMGLGQNTLITVTGTKSFEIVSDEVSYEYWYPVRSWAEKVGVDFHFSNGPEGGNWKGGTGVMGMAPESNPGALTYGYSGPSTWESDEAKQAIDTATGASMSGNVNKPVCAVSLRDAIVWANALSLATGKTPVYRCEHNNVLADATKPVETFVDASKMAGKNGYRLPTKEEWTQAVMAGTTTITAAFTGKTSPFGWYGTESASDLRTTTINKAKYMNVSNIADLLGNAWEWTFTAGEDANAGKYAIMGGDYNWTTVPTGANDLPLLWETPDTKGNGLKAIGLRVMINNL